MKFDYTVETPKNFQEAVVAVRKAVEAKGWSVLQVHDFGEMLASKGFKISPLKVVEICSGKYANQILNAEPMISLCMPCKINVLVKNGKTHITAMRPNVLPEFFPDAKLGEVPKEIDEAIRNIVEAAK